MWWLREGGWSAASYSVGMVIIMGKEAQVTV